MLDALVPKEDDKNNEFLPPFLHYSIDDVKFGKIVGIVLELNLDISY
ncbi:MAG: hypothetical protein ACC656_07585 [Candidatus Heimdallarchaeota archaeon]